MDRLKKTRAPVRALATRTCNEVDTILSADEIDLIQLGVKNEKLVDLLVKLRTVDEQILELLMDDYEEAVYNEEVMSIDNYQEDINRAKIKIERFFHNLDRRKETQNQRTPSEYSAAASVNGHSKRKFKLPKIELKKFSGN